MKSSLGRKLRGCVACLVPPAVGLVLVTQPICVLGAQGVRASTWYPYAVSAILINTTVVSRPSSKAMVSKTIWDLPRSTMTNGKREVIGTLITERSEGKIKPFIISEMIGVINEAVEAYTSSTAAMRGSRSKIKKLYEPAGPRQVRYIGPTADDVLENYLTSHGLDRSSFMWCDLSRIVIDKAENGWFNEEDLAFRCTVNKLPFVI